MRRVLVIAAFATLAACAPTQEELRASYASTCAGYGLTVGSPEMAQCVQQEALARQAKLSAMSNTLLAPMLPRRSTSCYRSGQAVRCY